MVNAGEGPTIPLPSPIDYREIELNDSLSLLITSTFDGPSEGDPEYEQFLADVWVGIVLTLMVLSCVCCMCSCLLYHKFQQWKRSVLEARTNQNLESGRTEIDLPSYTIASGLPTYQEALEQLKKVKELKKGKLGDNDEGLMMVQSTSPSPPQPPNSLSVVNLFQLYRNQDVADVKPT